MANIGNIEGAITLKDLSAQGLTSFQNRTTKSLGAVKMATIDLEKQFIRLSKTPALRADAATSAKVLAGINAQNRAIQESIAAHNKGARAVELLNNKREVSARLLAVGITRESAYGKQITSQIQLQQKLRGELARVTTQQKAQDKAARQLSGAWDHLKRRVTLAAVALASALPVIAVKSFADFDAAMNESLAIMGNVSNDMRDQMEEVARTVAKELEPSAVEAAESYFFLASAGLDAKQSVAAMPQVAKFAQAGMFDMARATDLATDAQSALGLTVRNDAIKNLENLTRVTDVLTKANILANASVEQFSVALTSEAGAAIKTVGKDIEEGVAVLAAFADQGIKSEKAGNALSRVIRLMTSAAVKNVDAYKRLNVEVFDNEGRMRNFADIIGDLERALGGMSDKQRTAALESLGFQARLQGVILPLLGTSEAIRRYEGELRNAAGITDEVANKQLLTLSKQLGLAKDRLIDVAIIAGEQMVPAMQVVASELSKLAENEEFKDFAVEFGEFVAGAIQDVIDISKFLIENVDTIKVGLSALVALKVHAWAMTVVAGFRAATAAGIAFNLSLGPVVAALAALGVTAHTVIERWKRESEEGTQSIVNANNRAKESIRQLREEMSKGLIQSGTFQEAVDRSAQLGIQIQNTEQRVEDLKKELDDLHSGRTTLQSDAYYFAQERITGALEKEESKLQDLKLEMLNVDTALRKAKGTTIKWAEETENTGKATEDTTDDLEDFEDEISKTQKSLTDFIEGALPNYRQNIKKLTREYEELGKKIGFTAELTASYNEQVRQILQAELDKVIEKIAKAREAEAKTLKKVADEQHKLFEQTSKELEEKLDVPPVDKLGKELSDSLNEGLEKVWDTFIKDSQRALSQFFVDVLQGSGKSLDDFGKSLKDMLFNVLADYLAQWIVTQAKMLAASLKRIAKEKAAQQAANASGGGGGTSSLQGLGSGGARGISSGAIAWGAVGAIALGIAYGMGWIGSKGSQGVGGVSFGGDDLDIDDAWANRKKNVKVVMEKVKEAIKEIQSFVEDMQLGIERFGEVIVEKRNKTYTIVARGQEAIAGLNAAGMTAEEIEDAIAALTIRTSSFGNSISAFLAATIHQSKAITTAQLRAEIEMARAIENLGRTDIEQRIIGIAARFDPMFRFIGQQFADNLEQGVIGFERTVLGEVEEWKAAWRELTGVQLTPQEQLEIMRSNARVFEAEKALRLAEVQFRIKQLQAQKQLEINRARIDIEGIKVQARIESGRRQVELAALRGRYQFALATAEVYRAEESLAIEHLNVMNQIVGVGASILDAEIAALNQLIAALESIPTIDIDRIRLPGGGGGRGRGAQRRQEQDQLREALDQFDLSLLSDVQRALAEINQRYEEGMRFVHDNADLIARVNERREREIALLHEQLRSDVFGQLESFVQSNNQLLPILRERQSIETRLNELFSEGIITAEELANALSQLTAEESRRIDELRSNVLSQADNLMVELLRAAGRTEEAAELQWRLSIEEYRLRISTLEAEHALLRTTVHAVSGIAATFGGLLDAAGQVIDPFRDVIDRMRELLGEIESAGPPQVDNGGTDTVGSSGGSINSIVDDLESARDHARDAIQDIIRSAMNPYQRELLELNEQFAEYRRLLGNTPDVLRAYNIALGQLNDRYTHNLRETLEMLGSSAFTPQQTIASLQSQFDEIISSGDLSRSDELARIINDLEQAYGAAYGTAGGGFQALIARLRADAMAFLGESNRDLANVLQFPSSSNVSDLASSNPVVSRVDQSNTILNKIEVNTRRTGDEVRRSNIESITARRLQHGDMKRLHDSLRSRGLKVRAS